MQNLELSIFFVLAFSRVIHCGIYVCVKCSSIERLSIHKIAEKVSALPILYGVDDYQYTYIYAMLCTPYAMMWFFRNESIFVSVYIVLATVSKHSNKTTVEMILRTLS